MTDITETASTASNALYIAALGNKNQEYYLSKFQALDQRGPGLHASWNWAAFFFVGIWALYRKMYGWFFASWLVATMLTVFEKIPNAAIQLTLAVASLASWIGLAIFADSLYHRKIKGMIAAANKASSDVSFVSGRLGAKGGVHSWTPIVFGAIPVIAIFAAVSISEFTEKLNKPTTATTNEIRPVTSAPSVPGVQTDAFRSPETDATKFQETRNLAEEGDAVAQFKLGRMYSTGEGVPKDEQQAATWHLKAAVQGNADGQLAAGYRYWTGNGVPKNAAKGMQLVQKAAAQGLDRAQIVLASMYWSGDESWRDPVLAYSWVNVAAGNGDKYAVLQREQYEKDMFINGQSRVERTLSPAEISEAQRLSSNWETGQIIVREAISRVAKSGTLRQR